MFKTETVNDTVNSDILIDETMSIVTADENLFLLILVIVLTAMMNPFTP